MNLRELLQRKAKAIADARAVIDGATNGVLSADEQKRYDAHIADAKSLSETISRHETQAAEERALATITAATSARTADPAAPGTSEHRSPTMSPEYRKAWGRYLRGDVSARAELRASTIAADTGADGGYMVGPEEWISGLLQNVDDLVWIRKEVGDAVLRVERSDTLGQASLDTDLADFDWTTELGTGSQGDIKVGKRESRTHPMAKRVKISEKLLRLVPSTELLVRARIAYKLAVTQEKAYLTGNGVGQPLGAFVASANGVPTSQDVSSDNTTTEIRFDNIKRVKYTLKPQYWDGASWLFHTDAVSQLSRLKDGNGQYIWQNSDKQGEPDRMEGFPVRMSQFSPNTFTTGLYVGILANWKRGYRIVDSLDLSVKVLDQLYAETAEVGYIARYEGDGQPVIAEAFVRVKLA